ncbi:MAG: hypothetical protein AB7U35_12700, partial [Sphingobium sp.]
HFRRRWRKPKCTERRRFVIHEQLWRKLIFGWKQFIVRRWRWKQFHFEFFRRRRQFLFLVRRWRKPP